jgi:hypothetical protein
MRIHIPLLLLLACVAPLAQAAVCPSNSMGVGAGQVTSNLPTDSHRDGPTFVTYNVPAGTLSLNMNMCSTSPECGTSANVVVEDDFSLYGLPPGTPVTLTAHVAGYINAGFGGFSYSNVTAYLKDAFGGQATSVFGTYDATLPVAAVAGQTFRLHFELDGFALSSSGSGSATFSFTGIPPGAAVTSCQGYVSDHSVAARAMTWGRLKTHYR